MSLILAITSSLCFAVGMFLTKGVTLRISIYKAIGPLFILNALFATPFIPFGPHWVIWSGPVPYLHLLGALSSGVTAGIIFTMISQSSASVVTVGQAITPVVVLLLGPIALGSRIVPAQIIAICILLVTTIFPLRKSLGGISSSLTLALMLLMGVMGGLATTAVALLYRRSVGVSETFIVRQTIAGIVFMVIFPPEGLHLRDFVQLVRRSFFMSIGWMTSIYAIQKGDPVLVQSVMAAIPIWVVLIEIMIHRKLPSSAVVFSAFAISAGVGLLQLFN